MITTSLRSSSFNQHSMCEHSYFLTYVLNYNFPAGKKAALGNCLHKIAETFSYKKLALQNNQDGYEDEIFGYLKNDEITLDFVTQLSVDHYRKIEPFHKWLPGDFNLVKGWAEKLFAMNNGSFNPMNLNIIQPEKKFTFEIKKDWAHYSFDLERYGKLEGNLIIRGTVDLVTNEGDGTYVVTDYKSGRALDWATGLEKDYKKLRYDPQLCIYYLAMCNEYPEAKTILMQILFLNDSGPFTLPFEKTDIPYCEEIIRNKFEKIVQTAKPRLNITWRCDKLCPFSKNTYKDTGVTLCKHFADEVQEKGADQVFIEYGSVEGLSFYAGGGRAGTV